MNPYDDDLALEEIDWDLVARIADNELKRLSNIEWNQYDWPEISASLANYYLYLYFQDEEMFKPFAQMALVEAEQKFIDLPFELSDVWSDEFVIGHGLAVAARNHASADVASLLNDGIFRREARRAQKVNHSLLFSIGEDVDKARLQGVNMERQIQSSQFCTPNDIARRAVDIEVSNDSTAFDVLEPCDFEKIATDLMDSFMDIQLDYADYEEIDDRIAVAVEEKLSVKETRKVQKL